MTPVGTRRVFVTGGGTGLGRAIAEALLKAGGQVVVTGRRMAPLQTLAEAWPGKAFALPADLASASEREGIVERARHLLGGLDGFVHSAGIVEHQLPGNIDEGALRAQLEVNLVAPLRLAEQALTVLEPGGGMVFVASTLATRPVVTSAVYSAAKAGLLQVMKVMALAGAPRQIRANAVLPGVVRTEMTEQLRLNPGEAPPQGDAAVARREAQLEQLRQLHPLGRLGQPSEVADAVLHLLGAQWTTGSELVIDGGLLLRE